MICVCPTMADTSIDAHFGQEKVPHRQTNPCQTGFDQYPTMIHFSRYQTMADLWRNGTPSPNISEPNPASQCYQTTTPSGVGQHKGLWSNPGCSFQMPIAATCSVLVPCWWILPAHHKNVASWTDRHSMRLLKRLNYDTTKTRIFQCFEMKPASNFCTRFIKPLSDESSALDVQAHVIPEAHEGHFSFTKSCQCETTHRCMLPVHPNTHTHTPNKSKHPRHNTATLVRNGFVPKVFKPCNKLNCQHWWACCQLWSVGLFCSFKSVYCNFPWATTALAKTLDTYSMDTYGAYGSTHNVFSLWSFCRHHTCPFHSCDSKSQLAIQLAIH